MPDGLPADERRGLQRPKLLEDARPTCAQLDGELIG
jgi:hypothetical protein